MKNPGVAVTNWVVVGPTAQVVIYQRNAHGRAEGHDMWKRDEAVKPTSGQPASPAPVVPTPSASTSAAPQPESRRIERDMVNIGKSVVIKGELNGSEDLTIEGQVEGK